MTGEEKILAAISELKTNQENMQKDINKRFDDMQKDIDTMKSNIHVMQGDIDRLKEGQTATAYQFANVVKIISNVKAELKEDIRNVQKDLNDFKLETNRNFKLIDQRFKLSESRMDRKFKRFKKDMQAEFKQFKQEMQTEFREFKQEMQIEFREFKQEMRTEYKGFKQEMQTEFKGFKREFEPRMENGFEQVNQRLDNLILGGVDYILQTNEKVEELQRIANLV